MPANVVTVTAFSGCPKRMPVNSTQIRQMIRSEFTFIILGFCSLGIAAIILKHPVLIEFGLSFGEKAKVELKIDGRIPTSGIDKP